MKITECKSCDNSESGYDIIRCKGCNKIIGCYQTGFFGNSGCAEKQAKLDKCPSCSRETNFGFPWWEVFTKIV